MIWNLTREHLRAQRRYIVRMGAMVAVAVTLASVAGVTAATSHARDLLIADVVGMGHQYTAVIGYYDNGEPVFPDGTETYSVPLTRSEAQSAIDSIRTSADAVTVTAHAFVPRSPDRWYSLMGTEGELPWEAILIEGRAPQPGEVVLSASDVTELGLNVGDIVTFAGNARILSPVVGETESIARAASLTLVGVSRSDGGEYSFVTPSGYVHIDEAVRLLKVFGIQSGRNSAGEETAWMGYFISWDGPVPAELEQDTYLFTPADSAASSLGYLTNGTSTFTMYTGGFAILVALGVVAAALAMARNQAALRTRWVATARVLGARRGQLLAASFAEAGLIALTSVLLGLGVAYGAVGWWLASQRASMPEVYHAPAPAVPLWLLAGTVGTAGLLSLAVSAAPAWWAIRTSPVAALKPAPPEVEAPMRTLPGGLGLALAVGGFCVSTGIELARGWLGWGTDTWLMVAWVIPTCAAVVGALIAVLAGLQRLIRGASSWVERQEAAWSLVAAHALRTRERQAMVIAGVFAATTGVVVAGYFQFLTLMPAVNLDVDPRPSLPWIPDFFDDSLFDLGGFAPTVIFAVLATVIAAAVGFSTVAATSGESATQAALGVTRSATSAARLAFQALPAMIGIGVGAAVGAGVPVVVGVIGDVATGTQSFGFEWWFYLVCLMTIATAWVVFVTALVGALGACLVAFTTRERSPVEELVLAMR